jgi:uncharacterized SAM-binding protein YcdF (DUF218 family)
MKTGDVIDTPTAPPKSRWLLRLLAAVLLVILVYASHRVTLTALGRWLDVGEQPDRSDYVMLLNGDFDTRPFEVADLYHRGKAARVLITSVNDSQPGLGPSVHEVSRQILTRCGVPDARIDFLDSRCDSTFDEAKALEQFMTSHPEATFSVVTSDYHTRRSRWVLHNVLGSRMSQVRLVSARTDAFNATNWWRNEEGFVLYLAELLKSVFYFFCYGHGLAWVGAIVGLCSIGWCLRYRRWKAAAA